MLFVEGCRNHLCQPIKIFPSLSKITLCCGKTCGKCGKLKDVNAYFPFFSDSHRERLASFTTFLTHIIGLLLCYGNRNTFPFFLHLCRKSWQFPKFCPVSLSRTVFSPKFFVKMSQRLFRIFPFRMEILVSIIFFTGGRPCREK